jgi:hypothetical protein
MRDDIIQNLWVAVMEDRVQRNEITGKIGHFIKSEFRTHHNAWGPTSLDVPVWIDGDTGLIDIIPEEQALWR